MGKYVYAAVIRKSEEGGFWAEVPDLPGCFGQGATLIEAVESVSNGMETHLTALVEYGKPIPDATVPEVSDGQVVYVYANTDNFRLGVPTVSAAEAARMLGVTPGRVSQLIKAKKLVGEQHASGTRVTIGSIEAYRNTPRRAGRPKKTAAAAR